MADTVFSHLRSQFVDIEQHQQHDDVDDLNEINSNFEDNKSTFLVYLLNNKFNKNLSLCKNKCVEETLKKHNDTNIVKKNTQPNDIDLYQENLAPLEAQTSMTKFKTLQLMQEEYDKYQKQLKTRRYSVDFDQSLDLSQDSSNGEKPIEPVTHSVDDEEDEDDEIHQLRQRLLGKKHDKGGITGDGTVSIDKQLQNHENIQENLIQDMSKLVTSLKDGAVAFQTALDEDERVLGAAEIGIQVASKGISNVSSKLKTYNKNKLGWVFYILATIFMIVGLIITFIIIKLFPAL